MDCKKIEQKYEQFSDLCIVKNLLLLYIQWNYSIVSTLVELADPWNNFLKKNEASPTHFRVYLNVLQPFIQKYKIYKSGQLLLVKPPPKYLWKCMINIFFGHLFALCQALISSFKLLFACAAQKLMLFWRGGALVLSPQKKTFLKK